MFTTVKKTRAGANVMKFQGPKRLLDPGTVARSLIDPETAEKTVPPCLARLDKPDCMLFVFIFVFMLVACYVICCNLVKAH